MDVWVNWHSGAYVDSVMDCLNTNPRLTTRPHTQVLMVELDGVLFDLVGLPGR